MYIYNDSWSDDGQEIQPCGTKNTLAPREGREKGKRVGEREGGEGREGGRRGRRGEGKKRGRGVGERRAGEKGNTPNRTINIMIRLRWEDEDVWWEAFSFLLVPSTALIFLVFDLLL